MLFIIAEKFLQSNEAKENYNVLLLQLVAESSTDGLIRIAAAISFKNSVKRNWRIVSFDVSFLKKLLYTMFPVNLLPTGK